MAKTISKPRTKGENKEQLEAFDYYVKLGKKRSLQKVADHFKAHKGKINTWNKKNGWQQQIKDMDLAAATAMKKKLKHEVLANAEKLTDYKYKILMRMIEVIDHPLTTVSELGTILKWVKVELGEPTEIAKGTMQLEKDNPFADLWGNFLSSKNAKTKTAK